MTYDHILIAGFGGPERPDDIVPFLEHVTTGRNIPAVRIKAVARQYHDIGGKSPYHANVLEIKSLLSTELTQRSLNLPIFAGYRHWHPFLEETFAQIAAQGLRSGLVFILAPFRSTSSCKRYKDAVIDKAAEHRLDYRFTKSWGLHPKLCLAVSDSVKKKLAEINRESEQKVTVIFSCHSIPVSMLQDCIHCHYENEVQEAAKQIAVQCGLNASDWQVAYHSRSGNPRDPWLGPDVNDVITALPGSDKTTAVLIVPLGFICENAEILYDLDILARQCTVEKGFKYFRAETVYRNHHFIEMSADVLEETLQV